MKRKREDRETVAMRREQVKQLSEQGYSFKEIALQLDCSAMTIYNDFLFLGIKVFKNRGQIELIYARREQVKQLCEQGYSVREMATELNCERGVVYKDLRFLGIQLNSVANAKSRKIIDRRTVDKETVAIRREQVKRFYEQGYSRKETAVMLNCDCDIISNDVRILGINQKETAKARQEKVKQLFTQGYSDAEIATQLNCAYAIIRKDLDCLGLNITNDSKPKRKRTNKKNVAVRKEQVRKLYEQGISRKEIAAQLNCSREIINNDLIVLELRERNQRKRKTRKEQIKQLFEQGYSPKEIAMELNCYYKTVLQDLRL